MSQIHIGTFRETCESHGCPGCAPIEVIPNRAVRIIKAPHVDEVIVTMGSADWESIMRLVKAYGSGMNPASEFAGTVARIVAADNAAQS